MQSTAAQTPNAFQWAGQPPKFARWGSRPHLIDGSLGPPESPTQTASPLVQLFLQGLLGLAYWSTRSIQPSTLRGMVKRLSALGLSNNKWQWWMRMVAVISDGLTVQVDWLGLRFGGQPVLSLHSSNEPGKLSQWFCHDDSTVNIISVIIVNYYYYYYKRDQQTQTTLLLYSIYSNT